MKQKLSNAGFAQVQAQLLALPTGERNADLSALRADPITWLNAKFELTPAEQEQLASLPSDFLQEIADKVADVYAQDGAVSFFKQEHPGPETGTSERGREDRDGKDILLRSSSVQQYSFDNEILQSVPELSIWIT